MSRKDQGEAHVSSSAGVAEARSVAIAVGWHRGAARCSVTLDSGGAAAPAHACDNRSNNTYEKLLGCMTVEGVREHQAAFQAIADNSDDPVYPGTRAAGTDGYAASVEYVAGLLRDAGYEVTLDPVEITFNFPAVLRQLTPVAGRVRDRRVHRQWVGDRRGPGHPGRHQPHAAARLDEWLRGRRLRRARLERRQRHRARPARHVLLRDEGVLCRAGGRRGGHHLQPGQHARPRGSDRRGRHERRSPIPGAPGPVTHGIPVVGASFADGAALAAAGIDRLRGGASGRDADRLQRHRRAAGQERRTTS